MKALAKISARSAVDLRAGTLRRRDLETFDALLANLGGAGTVLVTGAEERKREGAVGLAAAASAGGTRTALLECDLAAPGLAAELGLASRPGLYEYLSYEAHAAQVLQALVPAGPGSARAAEPLVCIVAGGPTADGRALLESDGFGQATARLGTGYELLVVDGPPLGRDTPQLEAVAAHADVAIACLDGSDARRGYPRRLRRVLRQMPARFAGFVVFE